jgi:hypothetical protein
VLRDVTDPTLFRHRLTDGSRVVSFTHRPPHYSPETFFLLLVLISVRGRVNPPGPSAAGRNR